MDEQALIGRMFERLDAEVSEIENELAERPDVERAAVLRGRLAGLRGAERGLVFGRIDYDDGTALHVGRRGLWLDGEPLLVDWRAPAAAPFYAATAARPLGLRRRRHLRLDGRRVVGVSDEILDGSPPRPDDVVGDGPLAEVLAAPRTGWMGDAVGTLQSEQDAIVRSAHRGITVVQGGPGTGKTVVALHRAAYALFAFPAAAERGVLVVGPNARFLDYISRVLPSLGENDVRLTTRTGITVDTLIDEPAQPEPAHHDEATTAPAATATNATAATTAVTAPATPATPANTTAAATATAATTATAMPANATATPANATATAPTTAAATAVSGAPAAARVTATEPIEVARLKGRAVVAEGLAEWVRARRPAAAPIMLAVGSEPIEVEEAAVAEAIGAARGMPHNLGREVFREYLIAELARVLAGRTAATLERLDAETAALTGIDLDAAVAADLRSLGLAAGSPAGTATTANARYGGAALGDPTAGPLGDPTGPLGNPTGPLGNPTGPLGNPTGPLGDPTGRLGDPTPGRVADGRAGADGEVPAGAGLDEVVSLRGLRGALATDVRLGEAVDRLWPRLTPGDVVAGLLAEPPDGLEEMRRAPGSGWTAADLALLDEAASLVDEQPDAYGHVVVDEAQELTEMDWRAVLRRCPSRSMTVVGDFAQAGLGSTVTGWREAVGERFELHTLTVNYRTTAEILGHSRELLRRIAPEQEVSRSVRHGEPVRVVTDLGAAVAGADGLVAVICPDRMVADIKYQIYGDRVPAESRLQDGTGDIKYQISVVPAGGCRGLEFDTVVVVAPEEIGQNPRDLYVALTRATQRLILVVQAPTGPTSD